MLLHVAFLLFAAIFTITQIAKDEPISLAMADVSYEVETELEMDIEFEEMEEEPLEEMEEFAEVPLEAMEPAELAEFSESEVEFESDFGDLSADFDMSEGISDGDGEDSDATGEPKFFNVKGGPKPRTIVYVVDNSNSMTGKNRKTKGFGRMETALIELAKSIHSLDKKQRFYIVFYSDTAYGLFHPHTENDYVLATPKNKQRVNAWLDTVECCLFTKGNEAFEVARRLKPDLIYLLGDGAFGDKAHVKLINNPIKGSRIEALGMKLDKRAAARFADIAEAHGGKYRDVGITPDGLKILQNFGPRKANNKRGPVWGVKLPVQDMRKNKMKKNPKKK